MKDEQLKVLEAKSSKIERVVTSREQIKQDASQRLGAKIQKKIDSAILRKEQRLNEIIARTKTKHEQGANARLRREAAMEDLEQSMHSQLTSSQSDEQTIPIKQKPNHAANVQQVVVYNPFRFFLTAFETCRNWCMYFFSFGWTSGDWNTAYTDDHDLCGEICLVSVVWYPLIYSDWQGKCLDSMLEDLTKSNSIQLFKRTIMDQ